VGFRWVSFTRASLSKVGQFWMRANTLPKAKPRFVSQMLDSVLAQAAR